MNDQRCLLIRLFDQDRGRQLLHSGSLVESPPKKPLTCVSKRVPGAHGKRGLERAWQKRLAKGWRKVGEELAKGWRRVGKGLAKG